MYWHNIYIHIQMLSYACYRQHPMTRIDRETERDSRARGESEKMSIFTVI